MITIQKRPYLIAEAGVSHFGSFEKAKTLLKAAIDSESDAFKIQVFNTDRLFADDAKGWKNRLKDRILSIDEIIKLSKLCDENNIDFIITPHDDYIFPYLKDIKIKALKIGSGEVGNLDFISQCFDFSDFIIFSTGLSSLNEIDKVVKIGQEKSKDCAILHCNTAYPTKDLDVNLSVIGEFIKRYPNNIIGYSDHTKDHFACIGAIMNGAKIIERHITLEKNIPNAQDWKVSSLPNELKDLRKQIDRAQVQIGNPKKIVTHSAKENIYWACKSPYLKKSVAQGEELKLELISMKRPFTGTKIEDILILNKKVIFKKNLEKGTAVTEDNLDFD